MEIGRITVRSFNVFKPTSTKSFDQSCSADLRKITGFRGLRIANATADTFA
jgi:hypothetical protein